MDRLCQTCGARLPSEAAEGSPCPRCLLRLGMETEAVDDSAESRPERIGPYKILGTLGEGGMGIVYLAEQTEPVKRRVALKLIKLGMDTKQVIARFEAERQALAMMSHPNVAKVFDAGATELGRPYFVMEYVPGIPITEHCDLKRLTLRERLELFTEACKAIQHAHQRGIIHRDIKPSNVLVASEDGKPQLKVIDFGVAKATGQSLTERTLFTQQGILIGTPEYMSPEQAGTTTLDVDTRTDIYSLGVLLYELLVGALPFDPQALRQAAVVEMLRIIREEDPPKPTTRFNSLGDTAVDIARQRHTDVRSLARQLRGELEWITMRALEKDPTRRYASASELAADVSRHLQGDPVIAAPPSAVYRIAKVVRRHRGPVLAAAVVVLVAVVGFVVSGTLYLREQAARAGEAEQRSEAEWQSYVANLAAASFHLRSHEFEAAERRLRGCPLSLRGWEWRYLRAACSESSVKTIRTDVAITRIGFGPEGEHLFGMSRKSLLEWDTATGKLLATHAPPVPAWEVLLDFSANGRRIVTGFTGKTGHGGGLGSSPASLVHPLRVYDLGTVTAVATLRATRGPVRFARFSQDAHRLVTRRGGAERYGLWDVDAERLIAVLGRPRKGNVFIGSGVSLAFSPDGRKLAIPFFPHDVRIWDARSGSALHVWRNESHAPLDLMTFTSDGQHLVTSDWAGGVWLWDSKGKASRLLRTDGSVSALALRSDDVRLAVGLETGAIEIVDFDPFDVRSPRVAGLLVGHKDKVVDLAFSADGKWIASAAKDGTIRIWNANLAGSAIHPIGPAGSRCFATDGRVAVIETDGAYSLWDANRRRRVSILGERGSDVSPKVSFSADGKRIVLAVGGVAIRFTNAEGGKLHEQQSRLELWDARSGEAPTTLQDGGAVIRVMAVADDGQWLATVSTNERWLSTVTPVTIRQLPSGLELATLEVDARVVVLAVSRDGRALAAGLEDGAVRIWRTDTWERSLALESMASRITAVAFSPDGQRIATATDDQLRVSDASAGTTVMSFSDRDTRAIAYSPDGERLVTGTASGKVRVWHTGRRELLLTLEVEEGVESLTFDDDGTKLVGIYGGGVSRIWDTVGEGPNSLETTSRSTVE